MAGAASALFLLDIKGRVLIWRDYRGDASAAHAEGFFSKFIEKEVFLDVVESVNILVNSNGQIIRSDVVGALKMRTYLRCTLLIFQQSFRLWYAGVQPWLE